MAYKEEEGNLERNSQGGHRVYYHVINMECNG